MNLDIAKFDVVKNLFFPEHAQICCIGMDIVQYEFNEVIQDTGNS